MDDLGALVWGSAVGVIAALVLLGVFLARRALRRGEASRRLAEGAFFAAALALSGFAVGWLVPARAPVDTHLIPGLAARWSPAFVAGAIWLALVSRDRHGGTASRSRSRD